ncbi:MAG TPA: hypothetical protein VF582_00450 [Allosphingosinicella sp.]
MNECGLDFSSYLASIGWRLLGTYSEQQTLIVEGISVWDHEWRPVGKLKLIRYGRPDTFNVFAVDGGGGDVRFAVAETSPGGYTFCVPKPSALRPLSRA